MIKHHLITNSIYKYFSFIYNYKCKSVNQDYLLKPTDLFIIKSDILEKTNKRNSKTKVNKLFFFSW